MIRAVRRFLPLGLASALAAVVMAQAGFAQNAPASTAPSLPPGFAIVAADDIKWTNVPNSRGVQIANVYGDSSKPGLYVARVRFPPHVMDMPHFHSEDRHVTVIKGIWCAGTGPIFDPAKATRIKAGGYMFHPAKGVHWDGAATDEEAIVQIIGMGPVATTQVHGSGPDWVEAK
jgi:quercetin dioxygenase-like cupin family protein